MLVEQKRRLSRLSSVGRRYAVGENLTTVGVGIVRDGDMELVCSLVSDDRGG